MIKVHVFLLLSITACSYARNVLIGHWTFEKGVELKDLTGHFSDVSLVKSARIKGGVLNTGPGGWAFAKSYKGPPIREKTLVSWVSFNSFHPQKGSVLTIDKIHRDEFDAIVLGEKHRSYWLPGSSYFRRTVDPSPNYCERQLHKLIQIAITYKSVNGKLLVRMYRNGALIGSYTKGAIVTWVSGNTEIFWGIRHGDVTKGGPGALNVRIAESRIYNGALTSGELKRLTLTKGKFQLIGQFTFEKGSNKDQTGNFAPVVLRHATIANGQLDVGPGKWAISPSYKGPTIYEKTLVSWVSIDSFVHQSGSVLTIDKRSRDQFDGIVLGERQRNRWMSGSSFFRRTTDAVPGFTEKIINKMAQLAISYENQNGLMHVRLYRNGVKFGDYTKGKFVNWPAGDAELFWGIRHGNINGGPGRIDAHIEESRIYAGVLTGEDLKKLVPCNHKENLALMEEEMAAMEEERVPFEETLEEREGMPDEEKFEEAPATDEMYALKEEERVQPPVEERVQDRVNNKRRPLDLDYLEETLEERNRNRLN